MPSERDDDVPDLVGMEKSAAVDALLAADERRDRERVAAALDHVTEDGRVSREAARSTLAHLSKVVSTPETRAEVAAAALSDARETAEDAPDLDLIDARFDEYETLLADVESRADALGSELQSVVEKRNGDVYEFARGVEELTAEANDVHRAADELGVEIEAFERWLRSPQARAEGLSEDAGAIEESVSNLTDAVTELESDPTAEVWAELTMRHRLMGLLLDDVRAELRTLRDWEDVDAFDDVEERIADVETRRAELDGRLSALAREEWVAEYGEDVRALESELGSYDPPVEWGAVREAFESRLADL